ncbi:MAG TPA: hypothetical protein VE976_06700 [Actinomycetota bacterium]|nr:hypothetical protein [Actinomycetota bacterium]
MIRGTWPRLGAVVLALAVVATACNKSSSASSGGGMTLSIVSPKDGASVAEPFVVKVDSSVPLGAPSTGDHHVHLCFDGASCDTEYKLVYGNSFTVNGLSNGQHTIEASLRNADHSDTGVSDSITVTVTGGGSTTSGASGSSGRSGGGYGYGS